MKIEPQETAPIPTASVAVRRRDPGLPNAKPSLKCPNLVLVWRCHGLYQIFMLADTGNSMVADARRPICIGSGLCVRGRERITFFGSGARRMP